MLEIQDLRDFSITSWYELFKNVAVKTIIVNIPPDLIETFRSDATDIEVKERCTEEFINQLKNAIQSFENSTAFVKTNWHAPQDVKFLSFGNTLKVTNINDIFLYLNSSDIISSDFEYEKFEPHCVALRPWLNIHPASEFRCIVINNVLRGITPRDWPTFYAHFCDEGLNIISLVTNFYKENVQAKFPRKNYVFDIIVSYPESISILDFSPLNNKTNLYAFSWKEIQAIMRKNLTEEVAPVFRYLESDMGIMTKSEALFKTSQS